MKLAIMQPYFFPYIGYYQLVARSDLFVLYDDVNFIKGGWVNRNRLIISGAVKYFTLPLTNASSFIKINEINVSSNPKDFKKILDSIRFSYSKSPYFNEIFPLIESIINSNETNLSKIATKSIQEISSLLRLKTKFVVSSKRYDNAHLSSINRVLDICEQEEADVYVNLPGGKTLYDDESFNKKNITLEFISPNLTSYKQTTETFNAGLSIIDVLMQNGVEKTAQLIYGVEE